MCRVLSYLGGPILIEDLLYHPDNSFIKQSYSPRLMSHILNLAGFGLIAWDNRSHNPNLPYIYKTTTLPFYDQNLRHLAAKITPQCLLTHVRGVAFNERQIISLQNIHPFLYDKTDLALAHNGLLSRFEDMRFDLLEFILPEFQKEIRGTTDSEWIYAVFISQFSDLTTYKIDDVINAVMKTLKIIQKIRKKHHINESSAVNLFISNSDFIMATRFTYDVRHISKDNEKAHLDTIHYGIPMAKNLDFMKNNIACKIKIKLTPLLSLQNH